MPKLYDRTYGVTEDELIKASKRNAWAVGDVLSAYTGQVKLSRIFEELEDNGDLKVWAKDCHCSEQEMYDMLINCFDDRANMRVYGCLHDVEVRCTITVNDNTIFLFLPVSKSEKDYSRLEARVRKLERMINL